MKCFNIFLIFFLAFSWASHAQRLDIGSSEKKDIKVGETLELSFYLTFSADREVDSSFSSKSTRSFKIGDSFYLANIEPKDETNDGIKGTLTLTPIKSFNVDKSYFLNLGKKKLPVYIYNLNVEDSNDNPSKQFTILSQEGGELFWRDWGWLIVTLSVLATLLLCIAIRKIRVNRIKRKYNQIMIKEAKEWLSQLEDVKTRSEIESLYLNRHSWPEKISYNEELKNNFFKSLNRIQFKKSWTEEEKILVLNCFNEFKNSLREKDGI